MKSKTKTILAIMHVLFWIIFIGCCIKTGSILYSFFVSLFINPVAAKNLYMELNLSDLKAYSITHYSIMLSLVIVLWAMKAYMFYQVIKIFLEINLVHPFSKSVATLISKISYIALIIGVLSLALTSYSATLTNEGVSLNMLTQHINGGAWFMFFAGIIYIISLVFKRGIEIQSENELTV
ncbi:MAG: DUF2975 domain-containing protein [Ferruginibacter sp.]